MTSTHTGPFSRASIAALVSPADARRFGLDDGENGRVTIRTALNAITLRQLNKRLQQGEKLHLHDVRTPAERAEVHVSGVQLTPLERLDATELAGVNGFAKDQALFIFCRSGSRAKQAAEKLAKSGNEQRCVVEGGTMAWAEAGLPVERGGSKMMSLERHVRIAAGTIVHIGAVLAQFVHPAVIWLSGFVGAGLAFAGITDTCAMGMLIAKLPWNRRGGGASCTR